MKLIPYTIIKPINQSQRRRNTMRIKLIILMIITSLLPFFLDIFVFPEKIYSFLYTILIIPAILAVITFPNWTTVIISAIFLSSIQPSVIYFTHHNDNTIVVRLVLTVMVNLSVLLTFSYFRIQSEKLICELKELTLVDSLTGLYNRRYFDLYVEKAIPLSELTDAPLFLIMIDIDYFKKINDTYGHHCGDEVLKGLASILRTNLRASDALIRMGGEEFVILLPETILEECKHIAERLHNEVKQTKIIYENKEISLTISVGVAQYNKEPINKFVEKADSALYQAKQTGRNRIVYA